jgi:hypothetical protein
MRRRRPIVIPSRKEAEGASPLDRYNSSFPTQEHKFQRILVTNDVNPDEIRHVRDEHTS